MASTQEGFRVQGLKASKKTISPILSVTLQAC